MVASPIRLLNPREMFRTVTLVAFATLVVAPVLSLAPPARAQIGNIFSNAPPRPPAQKQAAPRPPPQPQFQQPQQQQQPPPPPPPPQQRPGGLFGGLFGN